MKRKRLVLVGLVALLSGIGLASCGGEESIDPEIFNITYEENDNYEIIDLSSTGQEGSTILFDVNSTSIFYEIGDVTYNGKPTEISSLGYKFVMPGEDVEIEVELIPITEYDDEDDNLSWGSDVDGNIVIPEDLETSYEKTQRISLKFDNITSGAWITDIDSEIETSDESIIPSSAITFKETKASTSNAIIGGYLEVDLTKVKEGKCSIYVSLRPNNSKLGTLMREFNVIKESDYEPETMPVVLSFKNNSSIDDEEIFINVYERNTMDPFHSLDLKDLTNGEYEMDYLVGHQYFVTAGYKTAETRVESLSFLESVRSTDGRKEKDYLDRDGDSERFILNLVTPGTKASMTIVDAK